MKAVQILTQESIEKIEQAITIIEDIIRYGVADDEHYYQVIEDLKAILTDVRE